MKLVSIIYSQFNNKPKEWKLNKFTLEDINLIVGKNASGKSKILNLINNLGGMLSNKDTLKYSEGDFIVELKNNNKDLIYEIKYEDYKVLKEKLTINGEVYLDRYDNGEGIILAEKIGAKMQFQTPLNEIAAAVKRDSIQHPFLEDLYLWAENLRFYPFGSSLGHDTLIMNNKENIQNINLKDANAVIAIFKRGKEKYGKIFTKAIIKDLATVDYYIEDIGISQVPGITIETTISTKPIGLYVKEKDLKTRTEHYEMSQGMFRAVSLIIQLNYSQLATVPSCILIDDIGEGLDYDRSISLIKLIIEKAKNSSVQLIMSTNDKFIMNNVPLEYWSIINRNGGICNIRNYQNSKETFDDFKYTGLNNFDFFTSKYYLWEKN